MASSPRLCGRRCLKPMTEEQRCSVAAIWNEGPNLAAGAPGFDSFSFDRALFSNRLKSSLSQGRDNRPTMSQWCREGMEVGSP